MGMPSCPTTFKTTSHRRERVAVGSGGDTVGHGFHLGGSGKEVRYSSRPTASQPRHYECSKALAGSVHLQEAVLGHCPIRGGTLSGRTRRLAGQGMQVLYRSVPKKTKAEPASCDTSKYCWKAPPAESSPVLEHYPRFRNLD